MHLHGLYRYFESSAGTDGTVGLSQAEVAEAGGVSIPTLKRAEAGGPIKVAEDTVAAIAKAPEKAGVEFIATVAGQGGG
ncbi:helix-turn-helix transcriptional regulator [Bradyrhizobium sp. URHD0069]|uniref:helix-turn-helix domain-containing protein n=1 Tax=Bradyrhizobium sp. URHD0069 TaxID=1380355 RepID=UPI0009DDE0B6|nr:helix-turn-helix transcriptional regulator [Bradyrhizobium sp. URHD0069]